MNKLETKTDFSHTSIVLSDGNTHDITLTFSFVPVSIEMIHFYCAHIGASFAELVIKSISFSGYDIIITIECTYGTSSTYNTGVIVTAAG